MSTNCILKTRVEYKTATVVVYLYFTYLRRLCLAYWVIWILWIIRMVKNHYVINHYTIYNNILYGIYLSHLNNILLFKKLFSYIKHNIFVYFVLLIIPPPQSPFNVGNSKLCLLLYNIMVCSSSLPYRIYWY